MHKLYIDDSGGLTSFDGLPNSGKFLSSCGSNISVFENFDGKHVEPTFDVDLSSIGCQRSYTEIHGETWMNRGCIAVSLNE